MKTHKQLDFVNLKIAKSIILKTINDHPLIYTHTHTQALDPGSARSDQGSIRNSRLFPRRPNLAVILQRAAGKKRNLVGGPLAAQLKLRTMTPALIELQRPGVADSQDSHPEIWNSEE
jgi:hypothetical protein